MSSNQDYTFRHPGTIAWEGFPLKLGKISKQEAIIYYLTWALQIILAVKFISSAFIHAFRQDKPTLQYGIQKMGAKSKPILAVISALLAIDSVFLVLPRALGWDPMLTVYAAALGALLMLGSIVFHLKCRETPKVWVSILILMLLLVLIFFFYKYLTTYEINMKFYLDSI